MQGFNASANSDLKNVRTSEESLFSEWQHYGYSDSVAAGGLPGTGGFGAGNAVAPSTGNICILTTDDNNGTARGIQIPVGNNVTVVASTDAAGVTFNAAAKHLQGDTVYAGDADSTANYKMVFDSTGPTGLAAGTAIDAANAATYCIAPVTNADEYDGTGTWVAM